VETVEETKAHPGPQCPIDGRKIMFIPHWKHPYRPPQPIAGIVFVSTFITEIC
jgi:hypothetical protein